MSDIKPMRTIPGGFFIAFEGGENAGKSTQAREIGTWIRGALGYETVITWAPGGTMMGKKIRELLLDPAHKDMDPLTEALLFAADRTEHARKVIIPALHAGKIIVSDRWSDSAVAYQGNGRGLGYKAIRDLNSWAAGGTIPDLTVVLDMDPALAMERATEHNRFEEEGLAFRERVRQAFLVMADGKGHRYLTVDAAQGQDEVTRQIQGRILHELATRGVSLTLLDQAAGDIMRKRDGREDEQQTMVMQPTIYPVPEALRDHPNLKHLAQNLGLVVEEPHGKYGSIARLPEHETGNLPAGGRSPATQFPAEDAD